MVGYCSRLRRSGIAWGPGKRPNALLCGNGRRNLFLLTVSDGSRQFRSYGTLASVLLWQALFLARRHPVRSHHRVGRRSALLPVRPTISTRDSAKISLTDQTSILRSWRQLSLETNANHRRFGQAYPNRWIALPCPHALVKNRLNRKHPAWI